MVIKEFIKNKVEGLKKDMAFNKKLKVKEQEAFRKERLKSIEEVVRKKEEERKRYSVKHYKRKLQEDFDKPKEKELKFEFGQSEFGGASSEFMIPTAFSPETKESNTKEVINRWE